MLVAISTFTVAAALIVLLPGPDTLVVLRNLMAGGRDVAARTALGVLTGLLVWVLAAALGLSALLHASREAYLALRITGACYLAWLGLQALRAREHGGAGDSRPRRLLGSGFTAGVATDLLNPKVGVFFMTFLPGFIPSGEPVGATSLLLGGIFIVLTAVYFLILLAAAEPVMRWLSDGPVRRWVDRVTGIILIAFGLRLVVES
jgi:threonine/homoserine/homoserine lactone efflux protein